MVKIHLRAGDVYRMSLTEKEGITPKNPGDESRNKYFVIIGNDGAGNLIGFVVINSTINQNLPARIKDYHYPIKAGSYPFLKKDSFVNCSEIKSIDQSKFNRLFSSKSFQGTLNIDDLDFITGALQTNENIPPKVLKQFELLLES
jgi:mRNA-degrading endonuclease toxin of MazEF toxin-antitoxin module